MRLSVYKETPTRVPISGIRTLFDTVVEDEGDPDWPGRVNLVLTGDKRLQELNRQFRAKDRPTDVLSFNIDPPDEDGVFGEIYISVPYASRQAADYGGTLREEYLRLFCHGLLHLFGYDHMKKADAARMEKRQETLLNSLTASLTIVRSRGTGRGR